MHDLQDGYRGKQANLPLIHKKQKKHSKGAKNDKLKDKSYVKQ